MNFLRAVGKLEICFSTSLSSSQGTHPASSEFTGDIWQVGIVVQLAGSLWAAKTLIRGSLPLALALQEPSKILSPLGSSRQMLSKETLASAIREHFQAGSYQTGLPLLQGSCKAHNML